VNQVNSSNQNQLWFKKTRNQTQKAIPNIHRTIRTRNGNRTEHDNIKIIKLTDKRQCMVQNVMGLSLW